jgi:hypothetical protein
VWRWFCAAAGICVAVLAIREVFRDLFHPTESGSLSDYIGRTIFKLLRHRPSMLSLAGPLSLVTVIMSWALLQATGFALIYRAAYPDGFQMANGDRPRAGHDFLQVLYFSLEAMTTMGTADLLPRSEWLRLVVAFQALTGFALLTASVSWIVLLYPALARLRTLARRTSILINASNKTGIDIFSGDIEYLLGELALDLIRSRVDFIYFPIIYYFHSGRGRSSLSRWLPDLLSLADAAAKPDAPERVRLASATLQAALDDLAELLREQFVHAGSEDTADTFRAYAEDHVESYRPSKQQ